MLQNPLYSICMINLDMAKFLDRSIPSIADQLDERFEIVIVDGGSKDGSIESIKKLQARYPCIRLIEHDPSSESNRGKDRNISIREARGKYVLLHLDCDDVYAPFIQDWVKVFHQIEDLYGSEVLVAGQHINMASREFLMEFGLYNETIHCGEDRELWSRLAAENKVLFLKHHDFVKRLEKGAGFQVYRSIYDTYDHMVTDMREADFSFMAYLGHELDKAKNRSAKLILLRLLILIPAYLVALSKPKIQPIEGITLPAYNQYREKMSANVYEFAQRKGQSLPDLGLSPEAQKIFFIPQAT